MSPDDQPPPASLRITVVDGRGRPLRRPALTVWLRRVAPQAARGEVTLALIGDAAMRALNRRYARHDYATDVLSFPADGPGEHLGDIAIATGVAARQAREAGHGLATEMRVLALHGLLHLLGYDHARDEGRMARAERRLRRKGGLKEGLIARSVGRESKSEAAGQTARATGGRKVQGGDAPAPPKAVRRRTG